VELPNARWQRVGQRRRRRLMLLLLVGQLIEQCRRLLVMLLKVCRRLLLMLLKVCRCSCSCCCDYGSPSAQCLVLVLVDACDHLRRELHVAAVLFVLHLCWSHSASHTALLPVVLRKGSVLLHREAPIDGVLDFFSSWLDCFFLFFFGNSFVFLKRHRRDH
jgi:hypothetical protein